MRIYKNDIIKASAISTGADRGVLLCSITDSGFTSIAGVISAVKDKLPGKDHKKMIFEIRNDGRNNRICLRMFIVFRFCNNRDAYAGRFGAFIQRHLHGKGRRIISSCPG